MLDKLIKSSNIGSTYDKLLDFFISTIYFSILIVFFHYHITKIFTNRLLAMAKNINI